MQQTIPNDLLEKIQNWQSQELENTYFEQTQRDLAENRFEALQQRFSQSLSFGTAGLRGVIGPGPNAMNLTVIRKVSIGLAQYILAQLKQSQSQNQNQNQAQSQSAKHRIAIAYDARHGSLAFAHESAKVLASYGFEIFLAPTHCPTPSLAYAVLKLSCVAGIMVTASHNPPQDNGFKVYWGNGAQIIPPHDEGIHQASENLKEIKNHPLQSFDDLKSKGLIQDIPSTLIDDYLSELQAYRLLQINPQDQNLKIVYTAMHGVGKNWAYRTLNHFGYHQITGVESQIEPDPNFPTVAFPNPEEPGALDIAKACIQAVDGDILLANDPDADRLAVVAKNQQGIYQAFSGDQLGALIAHEILSYSNQARLEGGMMATTIVSSSLLSKMAQANGIHFEETLTGFKWIASAGLRFTKETNGKFLFGYEEAIGYSVHGIVMDKDGISVCLVLADMAQRAKLKNQTLWDVLDDVYRKYGLYLSTQKNLLKPGLSGIAEIQALMQKLRTTQIEQISGVPVTEMMDFKDHPTLKGNVLRYQLANGARILARPSGTEPKIKFYFEVVQQVGAGGMVEAKLEGERVMKGIVDDWMKIIAY